MNDTGQRNPFVSKEKTDRLQQLFKEHFHAKGLQCVESDDMIFLLSELSQFYFPSESNMRYTNECKIHKHS